jgi:hypothetical protein
MWFNPEEVNVCATIVQQLLEATELVPRVTTNDIGIVAPYMSQVSI